MMHFGQAIASGFSNYIKFSGRAARSEYWYWLLFTVIGQIAASVVDKIFSLSSFDPFNLFTPLAAIFGVVTFLPTLALDFRRLHDIDRTAWWLLISFTIIGMFVLLYWVCQKGTTGPNGFGSDPLA